MPGTPPAVDHPRGRETQEMRILQERDPPFRVLRDHSGMPMRVHAEKSELTMPEIMSQHALYPQELATLVGQLSYRETEGWKIWLEDQVERDLGSKGLTLIVQRRGPDSYHPENIIRVNHYFPVPPATYNRRSWQWWLFETIGLVEIHERMENFKINGEPAYPPAHSPGNNPYLVLQYGTETDRRTSFRGELNPE